MPFRYYNILVNTVLCRCLWPPLEAVIILLVPIHIGVHVESIFSSVCADIRKNILSTLERTSGLQTIKSLLQAGVDVGEYKDKVEGFVLYSSGFSPGFFKERIFTREVPHNCASHIKY